MGITLSSPISSPPLALLVAATVAVVAAPVDFGEEDDGNAVVDVVVVVVGYNDGMIGKLGVVDAGSIILNKSDLSIRPSGPVPITFDRLILFSFPILRTDGEVSTLDDGLLLFVIVVDVVDTVASYPVSLPMEYLAPTSGILSLSCTSSTLFNDDDDVVLGGVLVLDWCMTGTVASSSLLLNDEDDALFESAFVVVGAIYSNGCPTRITSPTFPQSNDTIPSYLLVMSTDALSLCTSQTRSN